MPDASIADVFLDQMRGIVDIYSIEQGYSFEETQDQTRQLKILACLIFSIIVIAGTILAYRYASVMYYYRSGYRLGLKIRIYLGIADKTLIGPLASAVIGYMASIFFYAFDDLVDSSARTADAMAGLVDEPH